MAHRRETRTRSDRTDGLVVETSKPAPALGSKYCPGKQDSTGGQLRDAEDELEDEDRSAYRSEAGTILCHVLDRPDIQFSTGRCMSGLSCPKVKHLALPKNVAWYLVDKLECARQFPEHKAPTKIVAFTDADWTSNEDDRRVSGHSASTLWESTP